MESSYVGGIDQFDFVSVGRQSVGVFIDDLVPTDWSDAGSGQ